MEKLETLVDPLSGLSGLKNFGKISYLNSVVQALSHLSYFTKYLLSKQFEDDLFNNTLNKSKNKDDLFDVDESVRKTLSNPLGILINAMWTENYLIIPKTFVETFKTHFKQFNKDLFYDAEEALICILSKLEDELQIKIDISKDNKELTDIEKKYVEYNYRRIESNYSCLDGMFNTTIIITNKCQECDYVNYSFDTLKIHKLSLPYATLNEKVITLDELIKKTYGEYELSNNCFYCENCRKKTKSFEKKDICEISNIFIIRITGQSKYNLAGFPTENLIIPTTDRVRLQNVKNKYVLSSIISYDDKHNSFTTYLKHRTDNSWYSFDDDIVCKINDLSNVNPYMLFYIKE